ncbi:septal ring lytic transglycosylase RlpA family protein [Flavobacterium sp. 3HN19-14]|uniref:septal ring lytic transglycosylase RlpA family protein n=1 Tax=Flavobacterium sp. 3HN19-14 TaxID=3448133 RepID=UPI003EE0A46F
MKKFIMKYKTTLILLSVISAIFFSSFSYESMPFQKPEQEKKLQDTLKKSALKDTANYAWKLYKKEAHASYYADKLNGRRTASGKRFDNNKYTAAHKKFPFGTKLKVTNEANGKSVIVEVTDRGPFTKGREIDLTKKAFMEIASSKYGGSLKVKIEVVK